MCRSPAPDDVGIKHVDYKFVAIKDLESKEPNAIVDVCAVVKDFGSVNAFTSKAGKELIKRELTLVDMSALTVSCTMWGERAANLTETEPGIVIAFKGLKVSDFSGRSLTTMQSSSMEMNPDLEEAMALRHWWDTEGSSAAHTAIAGGGGGGAGGGASANVASRTVFSGVYGMRTDGEKPEIASIKGTIVLVRGDSEKPPWYPACITEKCNKKATPSMSGASDENKWSCESVRARCVCAVCVRCARRSLLSLRVPLRDARRCASKVTGPSSRCVWRAVQAVVPSAKLPLHPQRQLRGPHGHGVDDALQRPGARSAGPVRQRARQGDGRPGHRRVGAAGGAGARQLRHVPLPRSRQGTAVGYGGCVRSLVGAWRCRCARACLLSRRCDATARQLCRRLCTSCERSV